MAQVMLKGHPACTQVPGCPHPSEGEQKQTDPDGDYEMSLAQVNVEEIIHCEVCKGNFNGPRQYKNHLKQKMHKDKARNQREQLEPEDRTKTMKDGFRQACALGQCAHQVPKALRILDEWLTDQLPPHSRKKHPASCHEYQN